MFWISKTVKYIPALRRARKVNRKKEKYHTPKGLTLELWKH